MTEMDERFVSLSFSSKHPVQLAHFHKSARKNAKSLEKPYIFSLNKLFGNLYKT